MKFCCFPYCAVFCFITTCSFTVINAIDEDVISETFKTEGSTRIFQTENTTDVYCQSIFECAGMCLSDPHCCLASYSKGASTCRIDTSERCCGETETLDEWRFIQRHSYHNCTINLKEVAYNKPAEQSSVYSAGCSALRAVDRNVNSFMHTNIEQSPYWIVDLGKIYQIKRIEILNRIQGSKTTGERLRDLDIMIGSSHNEMQICAHYVGPAQLGDHLLFTCGHVECARYVKLRLTGTDYLHVAEVFQRRENGYVDFYRGWNEYKTGFGDLNNEFWLGNENLHSLTSQNNYEMRIELIDFDGNTAFAKYKEFAIGDESLKFKLTANAYHGTAGNSLAHHNGHRFSTKDSDNDNHANHCATMFPGAWWFNHCVSSDLNGQYFQMTPDAAHRGIYWDLWKGNNYSLKGSLMMMRRVSN